MSISKNKKISVIIPTLNEAENISHLVKYLKQSGTDDLLEIIVVDANSRDQTSTLAEDQGAITIQTRRASRASQMNKGAAIAKGSILYFVHADACPPKSFCDDIISAVEQGYNFGCYRFRFNSKSPLLKVNSYFTRFKFLWCRGGDQTLFIDREVFIKTGGFDEKYVIMEDFEFIRRLKEAFKFVVLPKSVEVSARKYKYNSYLRVNIANLLMYRMFMNGCNPVRLKEKYHQLIRHPKDVA